MDKKIFIILAILVLAGCQQQSDSLKIGYVGPLTGSDAQIGISVQRGVQMAEAELGEGYEFIYEDGAADPKKAVNSYNKMKNIDDIDAVIGTFSPQANALAPLAERDGIIYCVAGVSDSSSFENRDHVIGHWVSPENEAKRYVEELQARDIDDIVVLEAMQSGVAMVMEALVDELDRAGISYERHKFEMDEKDIKTTLARLEGKDFEAFTFLLFPGQAGAALKQIKEMGFDQPLTSIEIYEYYATETLELLDRPEDWYVFSPNPTDEFTRKFRENYPEGPLGMSPHGYDCANIIAEAFESGSPVEYIKNIRGYDSALGTVTYSNGRLDTPGVVKRYVNGSLQVVD